MLKTLIPIRINSCCVHRLSALRHDPHGVKPCFYSLAIVKTEYYCTTEDFAILTELQPPSPSNQG